MAKMLGNTPNGRHSVCRFRYCLGSRLPAEDVIYRRNQRSREHAEVDRVYDQLLRDHPFWSDDPDPDIDDMIEWWHKSNGAPDGHPVKLSEYLGMTPEEYSSWMVGE